MISYVGLVLNSIVKLGTIDLPPEAQATSGNFENTLLLYKEALLRVKLRRAEGGEFRMQKNPFQRVGVFVDVQNMYYSAKNLYGAKVNFSKILEDAVAARQLIRAIAYVVRAEEPLEQTFFDALEKAGFEVKVKDIQIFPGGVKKADWDVGVVIDMIRLSTKLDVMVLVSGDGDYVPAVEFLRNQGHRIEVMGFRPSTSNKLSTEVDEFIDMDIDHRKYLLAAKSGRKPRYT